LIDYIIVDRASAAVTHLEYRDGVGPSPKGGGSRLGPL